MPLQDDLPALYAALAARLPGIVRRGVSAPDALIEDACQFAWGRLATHSREVQDGAALLWLVRTAVREAVRQLRLEQRELSLDELLDASPNGLADGRHLGLHEQLEHREVLACIRPLPVRQQRMLWLQALGLDYREMAEHEDCTRRTVERQVLRGKRALRAAIAG